MTEAVGLVDSTAEVTPVELTVLAGGPSCVQHPLTGAPGKRAIADRKAVLAVLASRTILAAALAQVAVALGLTTLAFLTVLWLAVQLSPGSRTIWAARSARWSLNRTALLIGGFLAYHSVICSQSDDRLSLAVLTGLGLAGAACTLVVAIPYVRRAVGLDIPRTVLAVGPERHVTSLLSEVGPANDYTVVAASLTSRSTTAPVIEGVPILAEGRSIGQLASELPISTVVLFPDGSLSGEDLTRLQWQLEQAGIELLLVTPLRDTRATRLRESKAGRHLSFFVETHRPSELAAGLKAALEKSLAVFLLLLTAPLIVVSAIALKLDDPGPALFRQRRVGRNGEAFQMLKLRSMAVGAEGRRKELETQNEGAGYLFKMRHDPRVTRVGAILRALSIDELPQLVNVLKGDMSLIGPRPALPEEVAQYDEWARRRLAVKPGISGLWQVSGRSDLSHEQSIRLDIDYVDNWSASRDLRIAVSTVPAVIRRRGAY